MKLTRIDVAAGARTYPVQIAHGLIAKLASLVDDTTPSGGRFIVSNSTVWRLHGAAVKAALPDAEVILIPDGERYKTLQTVGRIYEALIRAGADRQTTLVAVGGGVVGDIAGFAAATFLRGVAVVQVPTTLLGQVDSAIGGKVGVNHALGKNLIGAFHPPAAVLIDPDLLATLPRREFRAGLYEVVKYGMISSHDLFARVERDLSDLFARKSRALEPVLADCCRIKAAIVEADEREAGPRRALNFGHTIGHAIEAVTKYRRFRHGEAVGYGMLAAADLSERRRALTSDARQSIADLITRMGPLPSVTDLSSKQIVETMKRDKKVVAGKLHFVLPSAIGAVTTVDDVTTRQIDGALRRLGLRR
ncbi:MAG: 3-dehydroquinate synthase [Vicinamibacterales bacterium]|jgi:3-dehydroquinate synthase|nr:3-dehydroquinate synthase [Acidobacteriota bacterium]MDP7472585.1 3-dehydroquinate synthase [Vicinamibacterales bacterium]MDP7672174.1 3-dehydroquinate synthase [Vicinamibacterales bacterium]HJO37416.1 3-dehydroquinate synthase [Vicinamibacterales bacterium]|tara:strand:- start:1852 stop:2937 length:1086 start_codon:yes stop_codon:yes gene_type:complete